MCSRLAQYTRCRSRNNVNMGNAFDAHFIHQYIAYVCMDCWALSIRILLCHGLSILDRRVQTQAISDNFLWQNDQMVRLGFFASPTTNPRDLPPQRRGGGGGDARVPRRCSRRGKRTYVCRSRQCCAARYVNAHISQFSWTPHALALSVQTKAKSYHFLWQNARMFRLEFFAITVLLL
jgi:hypothetical protein